MTANHPADRDHAAADAAPRPVAPGGWRRAVTGLAVGLAAGVVIALLLPRARRP